MIPIFVPVFGINETELKKSIDGAFQYTKYLEFRADLSMPLVLKTKKSLRLKFPKEAIVLFTNRSETKLPLLYNTEFELINTDIENILDITKIEEQQRVLSYHQYGEFSLSKLTQAIKEMQVYSVRYYKLSVELTSLEDLLLFVKLTQNFSTEKWLLMGMGQMGKVSRFLFATLGFGTFASQKEHVIASGQIDINIFKQLLE